jgi:hypothetical protein
VVAGRRSGWRGARERAREEELARCSGWGRHVEARTAGASAVVSSADGRRQRSRGQSRACARGGRRGKEVRRTSLEFAKISGTSL